MTSIEVSAVIPVYNDLPALKVAIPASVEVLKEITDNFEILVAEDGSNDGSAEYVREVEKTDPRIRLLHSDQRLGRGRALNRAFTAARGTIVCYYDVDLATDMQHLSEVICAIREGYDIATGSRLLKDSEIIRTGGREIASRGYNLLVRLILGSKVYDHQCGFKAFNRTRLLPLLEEVDDKHWFWDTEVLVRGARVGYSIKEIPVRWRQGPGTTVRRKDVVDMGSAILRLWWSFHVSKD